MYYRKYKQLGHGFLLFAEVGGAFQYTKQTLTDTLGHYLASLKQPLGELYLTPGVSYKILNKLYAEVLIPNFAEVAYASTTTNISKRNELLFNTSLNSTSLFNLSVGFHFIL